MKPWLLFATLAAAGACNGSPSATGVVGNYAVMVTYQGVSDPVFLTIKQGTGGSILLTFTAGIATDPMGPNPDGVRANLGSTTSFDIPAQPARIDHSTGRLSGTLTGSGTVASDGSFGATFHYAATGGILFTDGGTVSLPDGGAGTPFDYMLTGTRR